MGASAEETFGKMTPKSTEEETFVAFPGSGRGGSSSCTAVPGWNFFRQDSKTWQPKETFCVW